MKAALCIRVVKAGGAQLNDDARVERFVSYVKEVHEEDCRLVVVHGGGCEIGSLHERLGVPFTQKSGLRATFDGSMDIVTMVLCGLVNKRLVARMVRAGLPAVGLCGVDLGLLEADYIDRDRLGHVGGSPRVSAEALRTLLDCDVIPIIAPVSMSPEGELLNVNADIAAQAIAVALGARILEFVTDVDGLRTGNGFERRVEPPALKRLMATNTITGGMIPKVQAALAAVGGGVERVRMGSYDTLRKGTATEVCE